MALASTEKVILGTVAFSIFWILVVFPAVPFLPIGRSAGSIFGAMLMVIFRLLTPQQAYAAVDLSVLGLLFGTMIVSIHLERADMFKYLGILFSWKSRGAKDLLCRICIVSAVSSALFTNDTACVILTEFILKIARENNLPPHPFLLALASSANIGSSATPIGNPQNLIIAVKSGISFGEFVVGLLPAMLVGVFLNASILLCMYWRSLSVRKDEERASHELISEGDAASHNFTPAVMSPVTSLKSPEWKPKSKLVKCRSLPTLNSALDISHIVGGSSEGFDCKKSGSSDAYEPEKSIISNAEASENGLSQIVGEMEARGGGHRSTGKIADIETGPQQSCEEKKGRLQQWKTLSWKTCVYLITVGMLVAFLLGLNMSWTALTAALILLVLDFKDAGPCLEKVSYALLVFFCGMFITVEGFNKTGIPGTFWNLMEPHSRINHASGIAVLAIVILVLSNIASNVPTVLLLGARVAASAAAISPREEKKAWLILAWVSTVAGNLSLLGSAANLVVCEQALRAASGYTLTFWSHLKFGLPSTLIVTAAGLALIKD